MRGRIRGYLALDGPEVAGRFRLMKHNRQHAEHTTEAAGYRKIAPSAPVRPVRPVRPTASDCVRR
eukprot:6600571-Prymnesium_polylepis.1